MIDLKKIKPKVKGKSDKYSWNLYKFLHKLFSNKESGKYYKNQLQILWLHHSRFDGSYLEFDKNNLNLLQLIIMPLGKENGRSFYSMSSILTKGRSEEFALPWSLGKMTDITDWFFKTYEKDGRCIFDRKHTGWMIGTEDRFTYVNNTRKCNWCGQWHTKEIHKIVKIKREEVWL